MNRKNRLIPRLGACLALALAVSVASAEDAPAAVATAPDAPAAAQAPAAAEPRGLSISVGHDQDGAKDAAGSHGIVVKVDKGDDRQERVEIAGEVVDRVIGELESSLDGLPEEIRAELDDEDMDELREALSEIRQLRDERGHAAEDNDESWVEALPGVVAILLLFGGPVLIVAIVSFNNRRKREMVHQTIDKVIEQGRDVPVELLDALDKGKNGKTMLARGTVNAALGVGIFAALYNLSGSDVATLGLIPLCIGVAQIIVWAVENRPADRAKTG